MPDALSIPDMIAGFPLEMDREGNWCFQGAPMVHEEVVALFHQSIAGFRDGAWWVQMRGQRFPFVPEDTPYLVFALQAEAGAGGGEALRLTLNTGHQEPLDPATLRLELNGRLYCSTAVAERTGFRKSAYLRLADFIEEESAEAPGRYVLALGGRRWPIRRADEPAGAR
ncbi:MAG: DUF1285 domain-containing protein [Planctomycetes bacterium]|nr:DUF1285 domain-containing protein [Planctomycetota bacterium]